MSLILDALKRADAERARGTVPDLHAQPLGLGDERSPTHAHEAGRRRGLAAGAAALVVAAAVLGWWLSRPDAPASREAAPVPMPAAARVATAPDGAPATPSVPTPTAAPAAVAPIVPPAPAVPVAAVAPPPVVVVPPAARAAASAAAPALPGASAAAARSGAAPAAGGEPRVLSLAELPEDLRRALPPLRFGGAVNSPNPASRLLIVDGQLLHEGDEAAPGVRIRQIRLRSVVLDFRGARVEVPF